jgi:excisionase family DNA binding protein
MACLIDQRLDVPSGFRGVLLSAEEWVEAATKGDSQLSVLEPPPVAEPDSSRSLGPEDLIKIREAARQLGVHENTIRNWVEQGKLQFVRLPGSGYRRVDARDVARLQQAMYAGFKAVLAEPIADAESNRPRGVYRGGGQQDRREGR